MERPTLEDYQLSESLVEAAQLSKAEADRACNKVIALLWVALMLGVAANTYRAESDILVSIFFGFILGGLGGGVLMLFVLLTWEGIWGLAHSEYRKALRRITDYEAADKAYRRWKQRTCEDFWTNLGGLAFEQELGKSFKAAGYEVEQTPGSGDGGVDLVITKEGETTIVQCKRWKRPAGVATARELYGVLVASNYDKAALACTAGFTRGVYEFVSNKPISLLGLNDIVKLTAEEGCDVAWWQTRSINEIMGDGGIREQRGQYP